MIKNIISYIFILSIFLSSLMIDIGNISIDIYWYFPLFLLILPYFVYKGLLYQIDKNILFAYAFLVATSIISGFGNLPSVFKQLVNIIFFVTISYAYLKYMDFNFDVIVTQYFKVAKIFLVIGFIQVLLFLFGFGSLFKSVFAFLTMPGSVTMRFQSFDREPSFAAYTLLPGVFISIQNIFYKSKLYISKTWSYLFLCAYFLTFSLIAYSGIILAGFIFYFRTFNFKKMLLITPLALILLGLLFAIYKYPAIGIRIDDSLKVLNGDSNDLSQINLSTYALYSNFVVTESALVAKPFFGSGLGTHEINFDRYIPPALENISDINKKEAASLALRLLSEGGIITFALFLIFLFKNRLKFKVVDDPYFISLWLLNNSIFVMICLRLFRQGHYTVSGFCLFLLIYFFSYKIEDQLKLHKQIK